MGQYKKIMKKIEVTEEMHSRILQNIHSMNLKPSHVVISFSKYKRYLSVAACFAVLLIGTIAFSTLTYQPSKPAQPTPPVHIVNSIVECSSVKELKETVGFTINEIEVIPFEVESRSYMAYGKDLAQITYRGQEQKAVFRKSNGSEDNSGDYNLYGASDEITVDTATVTLKGDGNTYTLAIWTENEFSYSLNLTKGLTEEEWRGIIAEVQ